MKSRTITIVLIAAITALGIHLAYDLLQGARADFTDDDLYSLSDGTVAILTRMQDEGVEPLDIRLYFSETNGKTLPRFIKDFITYERYLRYLLLSYERAAGGKIKVHFIDPLTDSDEEQDAVKDGLEGRQINQEGDQFFFGLTVETRTGTKDSIAFLWPQEQESIEYEITKRISSLLWPPSKKIGVLSSLEVFGSADNPYLAQMLAAQGRTPSEKWVSIQLLEQAYEVEKLPNDTDHISHDDYDLVLVIHPKHLSEKALWALDEWVVTGGKTIVFVDPYSITDSAPQNPQQPWAALQYEPASSLTPLLETWGLSMPAQTFAADLDLAVRRPVVRGGPAESVVVDLQLGEDDLSGHENPIVQGLTNVRFFLSGVLKPISPPSQATTDGGDSADDSQDDAPTSEDTGFTKRPLVTTTADGGTLEIMPGFGTGKGDGIYYTDLNNAEKLRDSYRPGGTPLALAYELDGQLPSAFPNGVDFPSTAPERPPGLPDDVDLPPPEGTEMIHEDPVPEAERAPTTVLVFADVDVISDQLAFQRNILGVVNAANDNHKLLHNAVDHLFGARELMSVRTARHLDRPFTLFDEIEGEAEKATLERERQIREEIEGFQDQLQTKQSQITERNAALFQKQVQDEVDDLNRRIQEANAELRSIRQQRRATLEKEENRIRFAVLGWMPALVLVLGFVVFVRRRREQAESGRGGQA